MANPNFSTDMELSSSTPTTSATSMLVPPPSFQTGPPMSIGEVTEAMALLQTSIETEFQVLESNNGWAQAYLEVDDKCRDKCQNYPCQVARTLENRPLNRYREVSPYDHSRVRLRVASPAPGGGFDPGLGWSLAMAGDSCFFSSSSFVGRHGGGAVSDYINASIVIVEKAQRNYILTQGPQPNTYGHFWLMVWQQNSKAVIMLNQLVEEDSNKYFQYWPLSQYQPLHFQDLGLRVHMLKEDVRSHHTVRYLKLENMMTGELKPIFHFHYTSWPDFGVPDSPTSFLVFLFMVRESGSLNFEPGPVVVHCCAGVGRSGAFTLIDSCLVLMEKKENLFSLNIRQILMNMREYRMGLIQTPEQLRFSYMAIIEGAKFLMGDECTKKKWREFTSACQNPIYYYDDSQSQRLREYRLVLDKNKISGAGCSGLATSSSGEGSSENPLKRLRDAGTEEEVLQTSEMEEEIDFKRTRLNPEDM